MTPIPRSEIPPNCKWTDSGWDSPPEFQDLEGEGCTLATSAAHHDLVDAIAGLIAADKHLAEAKAKRRNAERMLDVASGRVEYLDGLASAPFVQGNALVSRTSPREFQSWTVSTVSLLPLEEETKS